MTYSFVTCSYCRKDFLKDNRHVSENRKLGHKFYCSKKCQYTSKNTQKELVCENPNCLKRFRRGISHVSFRNFCSRSCYGTLVTLRNKSKRKSFKYCLYCGEKIKGRFNYCSPKCWGLTHQVSKQELINKLQVLAQKIGRSPTKRECNFTSSCQRGFGSWNNALTTAGLTPHRSLNQRMYRRRKCFSKDGHVCNSISELIIDNWLYKNSINHQKESTYPIGKFTADWSLDTDIFIEYFGLANDSRRYDEEIKKKQEICKHANILLIEIYAKDLFPKIKLDQVLKDI